MDQILRATKEADYHLYRILYWIKKIFCLKKKEVLIIITEKLQQCSFEYWLASQKHKERRSCRSNYNIFNVLYLPLCISWAMRASLVVLKNGCQRKLKLNRKKQESQPNMLYSFKQLHHGCLHSVRQHKWARTSFVWYPLTDAGPVLRDCRICWVFLKPLPWCRFKLWPFQ